MDEKKEFAGGEDKRKLRPVHNVCNEEPAEEEDLRYQKSPHAQRARLTLLLHIFKLVGDERLISQRLPPVAW